MALSTRFSVLFIADIVTDSVIGSSVNRIIAQLERLQHNVVVARSLAEGETAIVANPAFCCIVLHWGLVIEKTAGVTVAQAIIRHAHSHSQRLPILLSTSQTALSDIPLDVIEHIEGYIRILEDSPEFIAGRIDAAAQRYLDTVLPPFFAAMVNFDQRAHEYSWHTPGHTGGTAFMKTAAGRAFLAFYGEQMLRSDLSVSVSQLGSLNDHSGPLAAAEQYAARVFGADQTYFSVGGSSASNQIILHSAVADGDIVLVDRNCHKSLNYALSMSGAIPIYLMPTRNARGVIGTVPQSELAPESIRAKIAACPLVNDATRRPVLAALTNSTYDGLCYDVECTTRLLGRSVDWIHYDEAWFAYAHFNPIYNGRYGMHTKQHSSDDATVTTTHSTHKLLAALSQASMIHIRSGRIPVEPALFNEAFMMHTSTSPQYSIIASNDISTKMMDDAGLALTRESIREAIDFRQEMLRVQRDLQRRNPRDWWFETWQNDEVNGRTLLDADPDDLTTSEEAWLLRPNATWHGFGDIGETYCMLDPIKVTVLTPGLDIDGQPLDEGIPAAIVSMYLEEQGIVVEKTEPYSFLLLFSIGVTKGKWGSLVAVLLQFKQAYDADASLAQVLPSLVANHPDRYSHLTIRTLAQTMHDAMQMHRILANMRAAFTELPEPVLSPREAYNRLVRRQVEPVAAAELIGRTLAVQVVPYPPGIPLLMPGERFTASTGAIGDFLFSNSRYS